MRTGPRGERSEVWSEPDGGVRAAVPGAAAAGGTGAVAGWYGARTPMAFRHRCQLAPERQPKGNAGLGVLVQKRQSVQVDLLPAQSQDHLAARVAGGSSSASTPASQHGGTSVG